MENRNFDVKGWVNAWNTHSVDKVLEHYAENPELDTPEAPQTIRGKNALRENVQGWMKAFPDLSADIERSVVSDKEVGLVVHFSGTNRGDIVMGDNQRIPATNKKLEMPVAIFATLDQNGKIVKERDLFDMHGYMQKLGIQAQMQGPMGERTSSGATQRR